MNRQQLAEKLGMPGGDALDILFSLKERRLIKCEWDFHGYICIYESDSVGFGWLCLFSCKIPLEKIEYSHDYITVEEFASKILDKILENEEAQVILKEALND